VYRKITIEEPSVAPYRTVHLLTKVVCHWKPRPLAGGGTITIIYIYEPEDAKIAAPLQKTPVMHDPAILPPSLNANPIKLGGRE